MCIVKKNEKFYGCYKVNRHDVYELIYNLYKNQLLHNRAMIKSGYFMPIESSGACKYKYYSIVLSLLNKCTVVEPRNSYTVIEHFCHKYVIYIKFLRQQ